MADKIFTKGLFANEKTSQYGNFMNLDIKSSEFIEFIKANTNDKGYCKISLYKAKDGNKNSHYGCLNNFVPKEKAVNERPDNVADNDDSLPF